MAVLHGNHNADAAKLTGSVFLQLIVLRQFHELAVRVERVKHPLHRALDQLLVRDLVAVHVILAHALQHGGEQLEVRIRVVLFRRADILAVNLRTDEKIDGERTQQQAVGELSFHIFATVGK